MKKIAIAAALATLALSTPAMAEDFTGPRVEVTAGADSVNDGVDASEITYGVAAGYDVGLTDRVTLGAEVNLDNVFDRRNLGVSARLGYRVTDRVLVYGKGGYANWKQLSNLELEGFRVGGGVDVAVAWPLYVGAEYRYSGFDGKVGQHAAVAKAGFRF